MARSLVDVQHAVDAGHRGTTDPDPARPGVDADAHGTLIVNLIGCFAIASLMHAAMTLGWPPTVRATATIGFIGGFTTYSSFNYETMRLFEEGAPAAAFVNLGLTVIGTRARIRSRNGSPLGPGLARSPRQPTSPGCMRQRVRLRRGGTRPRKASRRL